MEASNLSFNDLFVAALQKDTTHGADVVTSGRCVVLVGFVNVLKHCIWKGSLGNACKEWGQQDINRIRFKQQEKKNHRGWVLNSLRFLSGDASALKGLVPALSGVVCRADPKAFRLRRLETKDVS